MKAMEWPLIDKGKFVGYQLTRDQAHWIGAQRGNACSQAGSWSEMPFQRMPNVNLRPGDKPLSLQQLIEGTDDAILIKGDNSYSIDQQRESRFASIRRHAIEDLPPIQQRRGKGARAVRVERHRDTSFESTIQIGP